MTKTLAKKYLSAIKNAKRKYVTCEDLSESLGKLPGVISDDLILFEPLIGFDPTVNLNDLIPAIEKYIEDAEAEVKPKAKPAVRVTQKDMNAYDSICDFMYQKMTIMGTIDRHTYLSDKDLRTLKKLISEEQARRKGKK